LAADEICDATVSGPLAALIGGVCGTISGHGIIVFASGTDADRLVAGLPAAARAVREAALAGLMRVTVAAPAYRPAAATEAECRRMAGLAGESPAVGPALVFTDLDDLAVTPGDILISGDRVPAAATIRAGHSGEAVHTAGADPAQNRAALTGLVSGDSRARLAAVARAALLATSKTTDGIVSRHINRPISRFFSRIFLAIPGVRPVHATAGTALLALLMIASLLRGDNWGLIVGALLFQAASIFDGVDGEIARATFRSSRTGAALDSIIDAITNLAFLAGVAVNLKLQGSHTPALIGFTGLALLAVGLVLIGRASARSNAPFSFDVVKDHYRARSGGNGQSRLIRVLTFLTSRDFFALGFALLIALGLAAHALALFAVAAAGWLVAVIVALAPKHA
jgi:CDP-L-myo-inositol myo-inositolphosphotransferase